MPIEYFKNKARSIIGDSCLLQRDRYERALFFSDFPKLHNKNIIEEKLKSTGFSVYYDKDFALFSPDALMLESFIEEIGVQPLPEFKDENMHIISCVNILRKHEAPICDENISDIIKLMHILQQKEFDRACRFLLGCLAVSLRKNKKTPSKGAELLLFSLQKTNEEEFK